MRTNFDFTPYRRSTVGFDRLFDLLESDMRGDGSDGYPPFDIAREADDQLSDHARGRRLPADDIEIVAQQNQLTITGKRAEEERPGGYLHRGIAARPFERRFQLADFVEVGAATFDNGLLGIELRRVVPEAMKPRRIAISNGSAANDQIEVPKAQGERVAEAA